MAPKPSRQEYLKQQVATAKAAGAPAKVIADLNKQINAAGKNIKRAPEGAVNVPGTVEYIDNQINQLLYGTSGSGEGGIAGKAAPGFEAPKATTPVIPTTSTSNPQNWTEFLRLTLNNWGLSTLTGKAIDFYNKGFEAKTILLKIQETPEYAQRFAGNITRSKAGMAPLDPDAYLKLEDAYRSVLRSSGMPIGFYDDPSDFSNFIAKDVSATELKSRVDLASTVVNSSDPFLVGQLKDYYNLTQGEMVAYTLDPERAVPLIERQIKAAEFGAAAQRQDITVAAPVAEQFASMGITKTQAEQGFQNIAQVLPASERLSNIYDRTYGQEEAIAETFGGAGAARAAEQRRQLIELEKSTFAGQSGVGRTSLGQQTQGQF
jgi:hypothetical protein